MRERKGKTQSETRGKETEVKKIIKTKMQNQNQAKKKKKNEGNSSLLDWS